ncbi:MAG: MarR family transcriptional regulator [Solirubrobacterales bacterium]|nr:MarR family transcriptional regulator [Solirubrobacterales bacterium]
MTDLPVKSSRGPVPGLRRGPGYLLARLGADSRGRWRQMLAAYNLTPHQFALLFALSELGEAHQKQLATLIGVDPRNAVLDFRRLDDRSLIVQQPDLEDRRRRIVRLTPEGASLVTALRRDGEQIEAEMFAPLDAEEREALHALLLKLFDGLKSSEDN